MTVNRTTLLDLPLPVTGTESGTWGDTTNNGLTQYLDIAIAGTLVLSTDADVTLTSTEGDSSATNIGATTAQYAILRWTATGSTTRNITALAQSKTYVVINATGGTQSIVLRGAGPTTGVTIISGEKAHCVWNGSDFVKVSSSAAAGGSNTQVQYNSSGVLAGSSNLTFDGTSLTLGGNPTLSAGTANGVLYLNGSKVATSGSALTFDGTNTLRINGSSAGYLKGPSGEILIGEDASAVYVGTGAGVAAAIPINFGSTGTTYQRWQAGGTEQMRLTSTGLGIGTSSPGATLSLLSATGSTNGITLQASGWPYYGRIGMNGASGGEQYWTANYSFASNSVDSASYYSTYIQNSAAQGIVAFGTSSGVNTAPTERMRLDASGNLGIGTNSPGAKLHSSNTSAGSVATQLLLSNADSTDGTGAQLVFSAVAGGTTPTGAITNVRDASGAYSVRFSTFGGGNNTERMRLDSSGNLGLGVTPRTGWNSGFKAMEFSGGYGAISGQTAGAGVFNFSWGAYATGAGTWAYSTTGDIPNLFTMNSGLFKWFNAPSGTAGNAITFTQAMTLSASAELNIDSGTGGGRLTFTPAGANNTINSTTTGFGAYSTIRTRAADHQWLIGASTQAMTLDASGKLYVGGTTGGERLNLENGGSDSTGIRMAQTGTGGRTYFVGSTGSGYPGGAGAFVFYDVTAATERARITSGGYFKASNNGAYFGGTGSYHEFRTSVDEFTQRNTNTNATTPYGYYIQYTAAAPNGTGSQFLYCEDNVALRAEIRSNGGLANYSGNDVNLSDRREKTNFAPAKSYLDTICAIPVQTFNYIDQSEDDPGLTLGVVAQDVQAVAPELVMESNWGTEENPKMRLSIYQTDLQYALMKCIQEQQALITSLTARVALLEGN